MKFKTKIGTDFQRFAELFNAKAKEERLEWDGDVLEGRWERFAINWTANAKNFGTTAERAAQLLTAGPANKKINFERKD